MRPPDSPRIDFARIKAADFLISEEICSLPVNPFRIIRENGWAVMTYGGLCRAMGGGVTEEQIADVCRSIDGFTIFNGRNYCIAYNGKVSSKARIFFTLMHETGHIICGHLKNFDTTDITSSEYYALETEADIFASRVLAPPVVLKSCGFDTAGEISTACAISKEASRKKLCELRKYVPEITDSALLKAFSTYIKLNRREKSQCADISLDMP